MANILMVVSAADSLTMKDGSEHPTGFWAEELVVAHQTLVDAAHTVHIATPGGAKPTVDQVSLVPTRQVARSGRKVSATTSHPSTASYRSRWSWPISTSPRTTPW
ncbi:putative intracellular protease/amidase [Pseudarthrobacter siccitolerans]|uniref:Intracellular protease/amidase n=1 Tax=Pseudarthrobacter siccitolerans TaxID=861266 RepID=A0ABU0PL21_9MICC|nr:putative intracellular protease/amidase [Pseudarthrobacter siccitolerans]